jgi:hypothetical protein
VAAAAVDLVRLELALDHLQLGGDLRSRVLR